MRFPQKQTRRFSPLVYLPLAYLPLAYLPLTLLFGSLSGVLFGMTEPDIQGFSRNAYDYHLDRADREMSPGGWMESARDGILDAKSSWERMALSLYGNEELVREAGKRLDIWTEEELEERFTQWLLGRFFGNSLETLNSRTSKSIEAESLKYIFHTDNEGKILYHEETLTPLLIRPYEEGHDVEQERKEWRLKADNLKRESLADYENSLELYFPELLSYILPERREEFGKKLAEACGSAVSLYAVELEARIARTERFIMANRTGDVYSLRKQSEKEAASEIIARLVAETEERCDDGLGALKVRIEEAAANPGDLVLAGEEWLAAYREQFERGLAAWEAAEERFFLRRIEWEQESEKQYITAEEAWSGAYQELEKERKKWELKARSLFESGETLFSKASERLAAAITEAREEFEAGALLRKETGADRARTWVDAYINSALVVSGAKESEAYWVKKLGAAVSPGLDSADYGAWLDAEEIKIWKDVRDTYGSSFRYASYFYPDGKERGSLSDYAALLREQLSWTEETVSVVFDETEKALSGYQEENWEYTRNLERRLRELFQWKESFSHMRSLTRAALNDLEQRHKFWFKIDSLITNNSVSDYERALIADNARNILGARFDEEKVLAVEELRRWFSLHREHVSRAKEALEVLSGDFGLVMGSGNLADILDPETESGDFNLDEYQIELIRARAVEGYWKKRADIARAVYAYAEDISAGRLTRNEGVTAWETAYAAYENALKFYTLEQERYKNAADGLEGARDKLKASASELAAADEELEQLNKLYSIEMAVYEVGSGDFILNEIAAHYKRLLESHKFFSAAGDDAPYIVYLEKARSLGLARITESGGGILLELICGNDDEPSFAELARQAETDPQSRTVWETRLAALRLLEADSVQDWYTAETGNTLDEAESVEEKLRSDIEGLSGEGVPEKEKYMTLLDIYQRFAAFSSAGEKEFARRGLAGLSRVFTSYGITAGDAYLPSVKALADRLWEATSTDLTAGTSHGNGNTSKATLDEYTARLFYDLDTAAQLLPAWIREEYMSWKDSFFDYTAARIAYYNDRECGQLSSVKEAQTRNAEKMSFLEEIYAAVKSGDSIKAFYAALNARDIPLRERSALEAEAARRLAAELIRRYGNTYLDLDDDSVRNDLMRHIEEDFIYVAEIYRDKVIEESIDILKAGEAMSSRNEEQPGSDRYTQALIRDLGTAFDTIGGEKEILGLRQNLLESTGRYLKNSNEDDLKHWRIYLNSSIINKYNESHSGQEIQELETGNPEDASGGIKGALTNAEGFLADAFDKTEWMAKKFNGALTLYAKENFTMPLVQQFKDNVTNYIENNYLDWDNNYRFVTDDKYYSEYQVSAERLFSASAEKDQYGKEIVLLGEAYLKTQTDLISASDALSATSSKIREQQEHCIKLQEEYLAAADAFALAGSDYDKVYSEIKTLYDDLEKLRFEYEKQDAIQRWASTSYLYAGAGAASGFDKEFVPENYKAPLEELEFSESCRERAHAALEALRSLYNKGEARRPFENAEYGALYQQFNENYDRMLFAERVQSSIASALKDEYVLNDTHYRSYQKSLAELGGSILTNRYPVSNRGFGPADLVVYKDGRLCFSFQSGFELKITHDADKDLIHKLLNTRIQSGNEINPCSQFEQSLRALAERLRYKYALFSSNGKVNGEKHTQWGLARDYLIRRLIEANTGGETASYLKELYKKATPLEQDSNLGQHLISNIGIFQKRTYVWEVASEYQGLLSEYQRIAWERMGDQERKDLEFYLILCLFDGGGLNSEYFSGVSEFTEYENVLRKFTERYDRVFHYSGGFFGFLHSGELKELKITKKNLDPVYIKRSEENWLARYGLETTIGNLFDSFSAYEKSSARISQLKGEKSGGDFIVMDDIVTGLNALGEFGPDEINLLENIWEEMNSARNEKYSSLEDALSAMISYSGKEKNRKRLELEQCYTQSETRRKAHEAEYRANLDHYIAGNINIETLKFSAEKAYGDNAAAVKNHYENIGRTLAGKLDGILYDPADMLGSYSAIAGEYAELIETLYKVRFQSELRAREQEWELAYRDINDKKAAWFEAARLILERGRTDWKKGRERFDAQYQSWRKRYAEAYEHISGAWSEAYLSGLEDKSAWVESASNALDQRAAGAMAALVGSDAETLGRKFDTRGPAGMADYGGAEAASSALQELLTSAGMKDIEGLFGSINRSSAAIPQHIRRGISAQGLWNTGQAQAAAALFAQKTNAALAARQAVIVAANAREIVQAAIEDLYATLKDANDNFNKDMDEVFISNGQWNRSGASYIKDIVVYSTFFNPVITERVNVPAYKNYDMPSLKLESDFRDKNLGEMNALGIEVLIDRLYDEIEKRTGEIFGTDADNSPLSVKQRSVSVVRYKKHTLNGNEQMLPGDTIERTYGAGLFGIHIGYSPVEKLEMNIDGGKPGIFEDQGRGQLGLLLSEYIYWTIKESAALLQKNTAAWEKPLWDDRGSWFRAPSLRGIADIATSVAAVVLMPVTGGASLLASTAINLVDDAAFAVFDVGGNYKSLGEAGFEFGKKAVVSLVSAKANKITGALGKTAISSSTEYAGKSISKAISSALLKGAGNYVTGLVTSPVSALSFSDKGGWKWSGETMVDGIKRGGINALAAGAGTFTSQSLSSLNVWNDDFGDFSPENRENVFSLNDFAGGFAEQGVHYAFGEDMVFNLFNFDIFGIQDSGKKTAEMGLLEMHLGREGLSMNIGSEGMNASYGAIASAVKGAAVWGTNIWIENYTGEKQLDIAGTLRTKYAYGDSVQKDLLWNILKKRMNIVLDNSAEGLGAETVMTDDGPELYLRGYYDNMSREDKMRLAMILGHEAYRDGYKTGETDSFEELKRAFIGKVNMGDRINKDNPAFYIAHPDISSESFLYAMSVESGNFDALDMYLSENYRNDRDYYWKFAATNNHWQNMDEHRDVRLLEANTREEVKKVNEHIAAGRYGIYLYEEWAKNWKEGDSTLFRIKSAEELLFDLRSNPELQKTFNENDEKFESIYSVGCMFVSTVYGAEAISGKSIDILYANELFREHKNYSYKSDLSSKLMADGIMLLTDGMYKVDVVLSSTPTIDKLASFRAAPEEYIAHIRIKKNGTGDAYHSEMVAGIDYEFDENGKVTGVKGVHTANPWKGDGNVSYSARTYRTLDEIARWDVFKISPTEKYYRTLADSYLAGSY